ncbi:MAG TPA: MFS transporter, partial [Rhizomicrobium sp.]
MAGFSAADARTGWTERLNSRPLLILFLVSLAGCYGAMSVAVLPALIDTWVVYLHIPESTAGLIASCNVLGATVSLALGTWLVSRMRLATIMALGFAIAASGDAASMLARDAAVLLPIRFLCGFGLGLIVAATMNWIGRHAQADRGFGFYMTLQFVFTAILFALIPWLGPVAGNAAVYIALLMLACCTLVLLPVLLRADGGEKLPTQAAQSGQAANGASYAP